MRIEKLGGDGAYHPMTADEIWPGNDLKSDFDGLEEAARDPNPGTFDRSAQDLANKLANLGTPDLGILLPGGGMVCPEKQVPLPDVGWE